MERMCISEKIHAARAQYVFTFRPDPEGGYSIRCAAFPELVSHGDSLEEARAMAREALELASKSMKKKGGRFHRPRATLRRRAGEPRRRISLARDAITANHGAADGCRARTRGFRNSALEREPPLPRAYVRSDAAHDGRCAFGRHVHYQTNQPVARGIPRAGFLTSSALQFIRC